jgi:hypothetical protein
MPEIQRTTLADELRRLAGEARRNPSSMAQHYEAGQILEPAAQLIDDLEKQRDDAEFVVRAAVLALQQSGWDSDRFLDHVDALRAVPSAPGSEESVRGLIRTAMTDPAIAAAAPEPPAGPGAKGGEIA